MSDAHANYLSTVNGRHVRQWLDEAKAAGCTGVRIDFEGNRIKRVEPEDVAGTAAIWGSSGMDVFIPTSADVSAVVRELNESGIAQRDMVAEARRLG